MEQVRYREQDYMGNREYQERERPGKRRRKKSHRVYAFVVLLLGAAIAAGLIFVIFYVQKIEVRGNEYVTEQEIVKAVQSDRYSVNTLFILGKYATGRGEVPPCLERMKVGMKLPWIVKVDVKEKAVVGYIKDGDKYAYFDKEGLVVLESSALMEGVPYIEGIEVEKIRLYQPLKSDDTQIFEQLLETSKELKKYEMAMDRIVCGQNGISLYSGKVRICLGDTVSAEKIAQIRPILEKLGDREGTLHLENYSEVNKSVTFEEGAVTEESAGQAEPENGEAGEAEPESEEAGQAEPEGGGAGEEAPANAGAGTEETSGENPEG